VGRPTGVTTPLTREETGETTEKRGSDGPFSHDGGGIDSDGANVSASDLFSRVIRQSF
jgi:hypothetical protein